jgi:geranylgeranyl transferase type-1 subunit beta
MVDPNISEANKAGSTYCCIAALSMLGDLSEGNDDTVRWLVNRQVATDDEEKGGFNGRVNKPADTCYSFWVGGALDVLFHHAKLI